MALSTNTDTEYTFLVEVIGEEIFDGWESLLVPAPMGIAIMSQLVICASRASDISIDQNPGPLIRHPKSFRTTLVQISNDAYVAFMKAHTNMERIQIQMAKVPGYVQECIEILNSGNQADIEKMLPRRLKRILDATSEAENLSLEVSDNFNRLTDLIGQVMEATFASSSSKEQENATKIKAAIEEAKRRQISAKEEEKKELEKKLETKQEIVKLCQDCMRESVSPNDLLEAIGLSQVLFPVKAVKLLVAILIKHKTQQKIEKVKLQTTKVKEEIETINKEYMENLDKMYIDPKTEIGPDKVVELLNKGFLYLSNLRNSWTGIKLFFEKLKSYIKEVLVDYMKDMVDELGEGLPINVKLNDLRSIVIIKAKQSCYLMRQITSMYVEVSKSYILKNLKVMEELVILSIARRNDPEQLDKFQKDLKDSCISASYGILDMVTNDSDELIKSLEKFSEQLDQEIQNGARGLTERENNL